MAEISCDACCVYLLTNTTNGKRYVGMTRRQPDARWRQHVMAASAGSGLRLHQAIRKHGADAFRLEVVGRFETAEAAFEAERQWVRQLGTLAPSGYNMTEGGAAFPGCVSPRSPRSEGPMRRTAPPRPLSPARRQLGYRPTMRTYEALQLAAFQQRRTIQDIIDEAIMLWLAGRK